MSIVARRRTGGFTLVELLVVVVILAVLAAVVLPKFVSSSQKSKEAALKSDLVMLRNAVTLFKTDTGYFPLSLSDLAATSAPAKGLDAAAAQQTITATDWQGPYVESVPNDPVSGAAFTYTITSPGVGQVKSSASGSGLDSRAYSSY